MGYILDESGKDGAEYCRRMVSWRNVAGAIRSLVNSRSLELEYAETLHKAVIMLLHCK